MKKWLLGLLAAVLLTGCSAEQDHISSAEAVAQALHAQGLSGTVQESTPAHMQTLTGTPYSYTTDQGESLTLFVYENTDAAQTDAACVSADGSGYDREEADGTGYHVETSWADAPHFYRKDNVIVQYIGTDNDVLTALETVCGTQFAGQET